MQIDDVVDSSVFIAASSGSVFIRNCVNCKFTIASKQLRTRDCKNCILNLYCATEPAIETSTGMKFAPFNGAFPGHEKALARADLDISTNKWSEVYDFNDASKTGKNWCIVDEDEIVLWCPLGPAECCIPGCSTARRLFVIETGTPRAPSTPIEHYCSPIGSESLATLSHSPQGERFYSSVSVCTDEDFSHHMNNQPQEDAKSPRSPYTIMIFGLERFWGIMTYSVSSVSAYCLGIILSGMKKTQSLLTFSESS